VKAETADSSLPLNDQQKKGNMSKDTLPFHQIQDWSAYSLPFVVKEILASDIALPAASLTPFMVIT